MKPADLPPDFAPLDGALFWPAGEESPWRLRVGRYGSANGPAALWVETDRGEPIDKVSVNLEGEAEPPGYGRIHVKVHGVGREEFLQKILNTGLLEVDRTNATHSAGFVVLYAETWRLGGDEAHLTTRRAKLAAEVEAERERRLAKDAAKRLGAKGPVRLRRGDHHDDWPSDD